MPVLEPRGVYVGELQEKWQFPSDHLPVGISFEDLHFVSWNLLDTTYIDWVIEKNSQGLSRSMIADEHIYNGDSKLTVRDLHIADCILEMVSHPTHPRSVLCLQECNKHLVDELRKRVSENFLIIGNSHNVTLIDRRHFEIVESKEVSEVFKDAPYRSFQDITLRRLPSKETLRLVNAHLPGDPTKPAPFEFTHYLAKTFDGKVTTVSMGDMNFDELKMSEALTQAFLIDPPFSLYSPYCTNISPYVLHSKAIDHILVYSPIQSSVVISDPEEIICGLSSMVALLEISDPSTLFPHR